MSACDFLQEIQAVDSETDALLARREGLPERSALDRNAQDLAALTLERNEAEARRLALRQEERRVEALVAEVEAKAKEVERTLYSGDVRVPKELEALALELRGVKERQAEHEEAELAVMEQAEEVDQQIATQETHCEVLRDEAAALRAAIEAAERSIDDKLVPLAQRREGLAPKLPAGMLAAYEKLRQSARLGGRVTARLDGAMCSGCSVSLPIAEVGRIRQEPLETVLQCPSCRRLLIR